MDFITENYLWIIIFIVIILMAVVGYIAEKTDFIKKSEKLTKPKKVKEEKKSKEQPIVIEDKGIDELLKDNTEKISNEETNENVDTTEESVMPLNDDIMSPLVDQSIDEEDNAIDQSLFAPLEPTMGNFDNGIDSTENNNELNPVEVTPLQDIDNNDSQVVNEEEDIWKF